MVVEAMNRFDKISVIMLTYNRESFISNAIQSIINQNFDNFEFIIIDNGSTDLSGEIAEAYAARDSRLRIVHIPKSNIGTGRNTGLDLASGNYVTFIDDDDTAEPDMLEFLYQLAINYNADISICGSLREENGKILPNYVYEECLVMDTEQAMVELLKRKRYGMGSPTKLWKRTIFEKIRFPVQGKYEDIFTVYKLFAESAVTVAQGIPKYCIKRHTGNNSSFMSSDRFLTAEQLEEYFTAYRERTAYLSEKFPAIADYVRYSEWSFYISMCNKILSNHLSACRRQLDYTYKALAVNYDEFSRSPYLEPFERDYLNFYLPEGKIGIWED